MDTNVNIWQSLALAFIQGLTEFLPVSSSGHLVLARKLFGWTDEGGLLFDTILHGGSLAAILLYFWREWAGIFSGYFSAESANRGYYRRLPWLLLAATVPVVLAGPVLKPLLESDATVRNPFATGLSMLITALLFLLAEYRPAPAAGKQMTFFNAAFIGCMQIVALLPGASRSGWTASAGILAGQSRDNAVKFAFLMAIPAIAGAIVFQSKDILETSQTGIASGLILAGFAVSFMVSLGAIHFCLKYFRRHTLRPFAVYLILTGALCLFLR